MLDSGSLTILNPALVNSAYASDSAVRRRKALGRVCEVKAHGQSCRRFL